MTTTSNVRLDDLHDDHKKYIGVDKPQVQHTNAELHWSERQVKAQRYDFGSWYDSDNNAQSPLEADLEDIDE